MSCFINTSIIKDVNLYCMEPYITIKDMPENLDRVVLKYSPVYCLGLFEDYVEEVDRISQLFNDRLLELNCRNGEWTFTLEAVRRCCGSHPKMMKVIRKDAESIMERLGIKDDIESDSNYELIMYVY